MRATATERGVNAIDYDVMCPKFESAISILGKKWTGLILRVLMGGPRRFSEFRDQVPAISDRILSERLQELEQEGIVERIVHDSRPVVVQYRLTPKGEGLAPVIEAIQTWSERWIAADALQQTEHA